MLKERLFSFAHSLTKSIPTYKGCTKFCRSQLSGLSSRPGLDIICREVLCYPSGDPRPLDPLKERLTSGDLIPAEQLEAVLATSRAFSLSGLVTVFLKYSLSQAIIDFLACRVIRQGAQALMSVIHSFSFILKYIYSPIFMCPHSHLCPPDREQEPGIL